MTDIHSDILGDNFKINHDIKFAISSKEFSFYFWVNLWFSCLDYIACFIIENLIERNQSRTISYELESRMAKAKVYKKCYFNY